MKKEKGGGKVEDVERKTFRLSQSSIQKIEARDKTKYRHEYQYIEAAIQKFSETEEKQNGNPVLEKILKSVTKIENVMARLQQASSKEEDAGKKNESGGVPEKFQDVNIFE